MLFAGNFFVLSENSKRVRRTSLRFGFLLDRNEPFVLVVLKVAVGQMTVVFCRFFFVDRFVEVSRLRFCEVPEEYFETMV